MFVRPRLHAALWRIISVLEVFDKDFVGYPAELWFLLSECVSVSQ